MEEMITSLASGVADMASNAMGAIGTIAPKALPVMGAMLVVGIIIKVVKKVTGK